MAITKLDSAGVSEASMQTQSLTHNTHNKTPKKTQQVLVAWNVFGFV